MAVISVNLGYSDYFKEVNFERDEAAEKEVLQIQLSSGERIVLQLEDISQNEELINKLIDAQIARKRQMGRFILQEL